MTYKEEFFELKKAMQNLNKKQVFDKFNLMNFFVLLDERSKAALVFNNQGLDNSLAIYFGDNGINYLVDSCLSSTALLHNTIFADMIVLTFAKRKDIVKEDIAFYKKHNMRLAEENNLFAYEFKEGYALQYLSIPRIKKVTSFLYYLISLLDNELEDIENCFKEEKIVVAGFDTKNYCYEVNYTADATLSIYPSFKKADLNFIEEYKDTTYIDDICYIGRYFEPMKDADAPYYDTIFLAYYEKGDQHIMQTISCKPNQFLEYSKGFLDYIFKEYGVPTRIIFNHRQLLSYLLKTLLGLNIDVDFQREPIPLDSIFLNYIDQILSEKEEGEKKTDVFVS